MKSHAIPRFWRVFHALPADAQRLVTVRIGDHFRALGLLEPGAVEWIWVGTHAEYDQLVRG